MDAVLNLGREVPQTLDIWSPTEELTYAMFEDTPALKLDEFPCNFEQSSLSRTLSVDPAYTDDVLSLLEKDIAESTPLTPPPRNDSPLAAEPAEEPAELATPSVYVVPATSVFADSNSQLLTPSAETNFGQQVEPMDTGVQSADEDDTEYIPTSTSAAKRRPKRSSGRKSGAAREPLHAIQDTVSIADIPKRPLAAAGALSKPHKTTKHTPALTASRQVSVKGKAKQGRPSNVGRPVKPVLLLEEPADSDTLRSRKRNRIAARRNRAIRKQRHQHMLKYSDALGEQNARLREAAAVAQKQLDRLRRDVLRTIDAAQLRRILS